MGWLRLEDAYYQHPQVIRAGWDGRSVFLAALTMCKLHNWWGGKIPKEHFEPEVVAHHLGCGDRVDVAAGIAQLVKVGLLEDQGEEYLISGWSKFQIDPTAKDRARAYRARKKAPKTPESVTERHSDDTVTRRGVTQITTTYVPSGSLRSPDGTEGKGDDRKQDAPGPAPVDSSTGPGAHKVETREEYRERMKRQDERKRELYAELEAGRAAARKQIAEVFAEGDEAP